MILKEEKTAILSKMARWFTYLSISRISFAFLLGRIYVEVRISLNAIILVITFLGSVSHPHTACGYQANIDCVRERL